MRNASMKPESHKQCTCTCDFCNSGVILTTHRQIDCMPYCSRSSYTREYKKDLWCIYILSYSLLNEYQLFGYNQSCLYLNSKQEALCWIKNFGKIQIVKLMSIKNLVFWIKITYQKKNSSVFLSEKICKWFHWEMLEHLASDWHWLSVLYKISESAQS